VTSFGGNTASGRVSLPATEYTYQRINLLQVQPTPSLTRKKENGAGASVSNHLPFFDNRIATLQLVELTVFR
jgi:hypothetical protein